mmetsp:Transcript_82778/g.146032  ORF Transcript_82778/g.146032 Transcript_82778/m.146032 type:complete len:451 (-) Transcript_82778:681-2033(-)
MAPRLVQWALLLGMFTAMASSGPLESAQDVPLSLLTLNAFYLPAIGRVVTGGWEGLDNDMVRAQALSELLVARADDFICLQETFRPDPRDVVLKALRESRYHVIEAFNSRLWLLETAGLSFASRHPIMDHGFEEFSEKSLGTADALAQKGVGYALVQVCRPDMDPAYVCVFLTHLQAGSDGRQVRQSQLAQIYAFVRSKVLALQPQNCSILLAGDLNVHGPMTNDTDTAEYDAMMQILHAPTDIYRELYYPLADAMEGNTVQYGSFGRRLDYVLAYPPSPELPCQAVEVVNCTVLKGLEAAPKLPVSDHAPIVAFFRIPESPAHNNTRRGSGGSGCSEPITSPSPSSSSSGDSPASSPSPVRSVGGSGSDGGSRPAASPSPPPYPSPSPSLSGNTTAGTGNSTTTANVSDVLGEGVDNMLGAASAAVCVVPMIVLTTTATTFGLIMLILA